MAITTRLGGAGRGGRFRREAPVAGAHRPRWTRRQHLAGLSVAVGWTLVLWATLVRAGVRITTDRLASSWQLVDSTVLADDPLGSVWYLHTQPPLHNLAVGSVLRWSPFPPMGTLMVLYLAGLVLLAVTLTSLLANWRVHPVLAGGIVAVALSNPNLLSTINVTSYEVPVTVLLAVSIWWFQRHLQRPGLGSLVGLAGTLTALAMTRSLFHPGFVVVVVLLAAAARPVPWRQLGVAVAVPVVLVGGWMLKNQVLFGTPTLSSWLGFNLQRGVVAPLEREQVEAAIDDGAVSALTLEYPWGRLEQYEEWNRGCQPTHDHPAVTAERKTTGGFFDMANFNHECFIPLYEQSQTNALTLIRREPGRYLTSRAPVLGSSFAMATIGFDDDDGGFLAIDGTARRTWMDEVGDVVLVPVDVTIDTADWALPPFPQFGTDVDLRLSVTLLALYVGLLGRGGLAVVRLVRRGRRDGVRSWGDDELLWVMIAATAVLVVVVGGLLEFGENGRFRSMLDPFLVALPLGALVRIVDGRRRSAAGSDDTPSDDPAPDDPAPAGARPDDVDGGVAPA